MEKLKRLISVLLFCSALLLPALSAEAAKQIVLNNSSSRKLSATIVVHTVSGWRVIGWYTIAPWSYKRLNFSDVDGQYFGVYAHSGNLQWSGKNNQPAIAIVNNRMNHGVREQPYGNNPRMVRVRIVNGSSFKFTWQGDQQQMSQQQMGGWW